MERTIDADICVIGGGSGGLSVAAGAVQMGARVVLIEKARMGGDCLNFGCVPSKSLIAAAHAAESIRGAARFGVDAGPPEIDFQRVHAHIHGVIADIAPHDSVERFEELGVTVLQTAGKFIDRRTVAAGDATVRARRFVVATGSSPAIPPIKGLDCVPYLTNETIFDLTAAPEHLIVIGGGPIGAELAQAYRRLGARVTIVEMMRVLGRDDQELAEIVRDRMRREGVELLEGIAIKSIATGSAGIAVHIEADGNARTVTGSHLLVATGRRPNLDGLDLGAAGIDHTAKGITVDRRLRTTNRRIFAIGDVASPYQFTHMAGYHAGIVIRNALFRLPAKVDYRAVPWVTFTDPELAHVGLDEQAARKAHGDIRVLRAPFADNDRARAERNTEGLVKIVTSRKGVILGATIAGPHAGELVQSWILPVAQRMNIKHVAGLILPYPTLGEASKRAAGSYFTEALFGAKVRRIVRFLARFG